MYEVWISSEGQEIADFYGEHDTLEEAQQAAEVLNRPGENINIAEIKMLCIDGMVCGAVTKVWNRHNGEWNLVPVRRKNR